MERLSKQSLLGVDLPLKKLCWIGSLISGDVRGNGWEYIDIYIYIKVLRLSSKR